MSATAVAEHAWSLVLPLTLGWEVSSQVFRLKNQESKSSLGYTRSELKGQSYKPGNLSSILGSHLNVGEN